MQNTHILYENKNNKKLKVIMLFVRDKGRMCNNILQYGHAYAWAREHGKRSMSMRFAYKYPYFRICKTPYHNFMCYVFAKVAAKMHLLPVVTYDDINMTEAEKEANERVMTESRNVVVEGWYVRHYDLFLKYLEEIKDLFTFDDSITIRIKNFMASTSAADDIKLGIHIRRGDYRTWNGGKYFFENHEYISFIKAFQNIYPEKKIAVYLCSNEPIDMDNFKSSLPGMKININQGGSPADDVCMLSLCDFIIGPYSTFSLTAAMFNHTPLCWLKEKNQNICFDYFENLFSKI